MATDDALAPTARATLAWRWPLARRVHPLPSHESGGAFGAVRRHDVHTGVDLYADPGDAVFTVEAGVVVAIEDFTGPRAGSPWWHDTRAVLVEGASGVVLYGELEAEVEVGQRLARGARVGRVVTVLKRDKGLPTTMLHLELYEARTRASVWWRHDEMKPDALRDPTEALRASDEPDDGP
jgi:murein DD-endopeptidase MepM/ murein hydrolase activator NlpD